MDDIFDDGQNSLPGTQVQGEQGDKRTKPEPDENFSASVTAHDDGMTKHEKMSSKAGKKELRKERREQKLAAKEKHLEEKKQKKNRGSRTEEQSRRKSHASVGSILLICTGLVVFILAGSNTIRASLPLLCHWVRTPQD